MGRGRKGGEKEKERELGNLRWTDLGNSELCFRFRFQFSFSLFGYWLLVIGYILVDVGLG